MTGVTSVLLDDLTLLESHTLCVTAFPRGERPSGHLPVPITPTCDR